MNKFSVLVPSEYEARVLEDLDIDLNIIGVGIIKAALSSYEIFLKKKPKLAFLTGWAGAYPETDLDIGDIVIASEEIWVDFGRKYPSHYTPLPEKLKICNSLKLDSHYAEKLIYLLDLCGFNAVSGPIATVCASSYDVKRALFFKNKYEVLAENMEGFGVAMAAKKCKIPFLEIRIISNLLENPENEWNFNKAAEILREVWKCIAQVWK